LSTTTRTSSFARTGIVAGVVVVEGAVPSVVELSPRVVDVEVDVVEFVVVVSDTVSPAKRNRRKNTMAPTEIIAATMIPRSR
jgi:hypothetical protein